MTQENEDEVVDMDKEAEKEIEQAQDITEDKQDVIKKEEPVKLVQEEPRTGAGSLD